MKPEFKNKEEMITYHVELIHLEVMLNGYPSESTIIDFQKDFHKFDCGDEIGEFIDYLKIS